MEKLIARGSGDALAVRSRQWVKLIGKLRWAGLEDDARRLETIVAELPTKARPSIFAEPSETD